MEIVLKCSIKKP
uniref:Uncharacterized protein n=1 Tax=Anguilla anguilla TaxID=7936 RepID=A0A0E9SMV3_ANGAN